MYIKATQNNNTSFWSTARTKFFERSLKIVYYSGHAQRSLEASLPRGE